MTLAFDSNIFIYALNAHPEFGFDSLHLLKAVESGAISGVASELVYLEVLSGKKMDKTQVANSQQLLDRAGVTFIALNRGLLLAAAALRRESKVTTPDAIHLVSARTTPYDYFVTNDVKLIDIVAPEFKILGLKDAVKVLGLAARAEYL
ncbi:MAG: type II toxin-antitoxin system VapC family toxin [Candidatus Saccharimonadales bacterium]